MNDAAKDKVQAQFAKHADKYVASPLHAAGQDLAYLAAAIGADKSMHVLDVATGGGHVANALAPLAGQVTAFDLTEEILASAEAFIRGNGHDNVAFVRGDAEAMPFADATFDRIACRVAAHHFPNVEAFVKETYRTLKPGGALLFIDNVAPEDDALDAFYNASEKDRDPSHVRALKKSEWLRLFEVAGFSVTELKPFRKTFLFDDWCYRSGMLPEEKAKLARKLLDAPEAVRRHFAIALEADGSIRSFEGDAVLISAAKREGTD